MHFISFIIVIIIIFSILFPIFKKFSFIQSIVISNFVIFFMTTFSSPNLMPSHSIIFKELAFNPIYFKNIPKLYTLITSMFIHYDVWHILGNMIALLFIGIPFEYRVGRIKISAIYILGGIFATIFFTLANFGERMLLVGASGAIFSILGGFAVSFPRDKILVPIPFPIIFFVRMRVITAAIIFAILQIIFSLTSQYYGGNIAYLAHLGGLIGGVAIAKILIKEKKVIEKFDYSIIKNFLETERQKEIFRKIEEAIEPEIKEAWFSYLLKDLRCPRCGGRLEVKNGKIYCKKCGYVIK